MGNDEIFIFNHLKKIGGEKVLKEAMEITTDDIKANRIAFGKKTNTKDFMAIFLRSVDICTRY